MAIEKSQVKFAVSEQTGETVGFVSRHSKTKKLKGVRENSIFGKKICVLSAELKGTILPNVLYNVELKPMHRDNGYVVVSAVPAQFKAHIETVVVPKTIYRINVTFGNKTVYFDPKDGRSSSSRTLDGALDILYARSDIEDRDNVIEAFKKEALSLNLQMERDGVYIQPTPKEISQ
jgi:hypothetical protein